MMMQLRQQIATASSPCHTKMLPSPRSTRVQPLQACLHELEGGQRGAKLAALLQVAGTHVVGTQGQAHLGEGRGKKTQETGQHCLLCFAGCWLMCDNQWRHGQAPPGWQATCRVGLSTLAWPLQILTGCQATMMREMASTLLVSLKEDTPAGDGWGGTAVRERHRSRGAAAGRRGQGAELCGSPNVQCDTTRTDHSAHRPCCSPHPSTHRGCGPSRAQSSR